MATLTEPQDYDRRRAARVRIMRCDNGRRAGRFHVYLVERDELFRLLTYAVDDCTREGDIFGMTVAEPDYPHVSHSFRVRIEPMGNQKTRSFRVWNTEPDQLITILRMAVQASADRIAAAEKQQFAEPMEKPNV